MVGRVTELWVQTPALSSTLLSDLSQITTLLNLRLSFSIRAENKCFRGQPGGVIPRVISSNFQIYTVDLLFILSSWHLSTISLGKLRLKSSSRRALKRERSHQREEMVPLLCSWISDLPWESHVAHFPQEKWVDWALVWETWPWKTFGGSGRRPPSVEWARGVRVQRPPDCQLPQSLPSCPQCSELCPLTSFQLML